MKLLFFVFAMLCASVTWSADQSASAPAVVVLKGEVLEVNDVGAYTYVRLKTVNGELWAAVGKAPIRKGTAITIENAELMDNFESKTLKKTFPKIYFGSLRVAQPAAANAAGQVAAAHAAAPRTEYAGDVKVPKATGPDARTVAEIVTRTAELKDKTVLVRAKVVKYSSAIMGKNWIHLRDGSGSAADNTNDVTATTKDQAKVGDVVLVKGVVRKDKDFGAGYVYKVLIEDATLQM